MIIQSLELRGERNADHAGIRFVTEAAFRNMPYAGGDEQYVIERLRAAGALTISLVAVLGREIIGHIAFSPAIAADPTDPWFALGPVSVLPAYQGQGVGSALINLGLSEVNELGALGCILTGNPEYYRRFGFELSPQNAPANEPEDFFMLKRFTTTNPIGAFQFHQAFYDDT